MTVVEFTDAVSAIKQFLKPIVEAIVNRADFDPEWDAGDRKWHYQLGSGGAGEKRSE